MAGAPRAVDHRRFRFADNPFSEEAKSCAKIDVLVIQEESFIKSIKFHENLAPKYHKHPGDPVWLESLVALVVPEGR